MMVRCSECGKDHNKELIEGKEYKEKWGNVLIFTSPCCNKRMTSYIF